MLPAKVVCAQEQKKHIEKLKMQNERDEKRETKLIVFTHLGCCILYLMKSVVRGCIKTGANGRHKSHKMVRKSRRQRKGERVITPQASCTLEYDIN